MTDTDRAARAVAVEATVTVDDRCLMTCEIIDDQVQLMLGRRDTGLHLYLDWSALHRLATVVNAATMHARAAPQARRVGFTVSADERSRDEHSPNVPNCSRDKHGELLVSDVDLAGRYHLI